MISKNENHLSGGEAMRPVEEMLQEDSVVQLCDRSPRTVVTGTPLREALDILRDPDSKGAVVVMAPDESGVPGIFGVQGIFTERDYLDKIAGDSGRLDSPIDEFMTPAPTTLSQSDTVDRAIRWMTEGGYRHLPVIDERGALVGLVSTRDIIGYLSDFFPGDVLNLPPRLDQEQSITSREGG